MSDVIVVKVSGFDFSYFYSSGRLWLIDGSLFAHNSFNAPSPGVMFRFSDSRRRPDFRS
ncbi:hypothetical protein YC2023_081319 [Brassica napus]